MNNTNCSLLLLQTSVVFVSNKKQVVPLWRQKAGKDEEKLVIWDYHVLLILRQVRKQDITAIQWRRNCYTT